VFICAADKLLNISKAAYLLKIFFDLLSLVSICEHKFHNFTKLSAQNGVYSGDFYTCNDAAW